jgi:hypothetical protein
MLWVVYRGVYVGLGAVDVRDTVKENWCIEKEVREKKLLLF